MEEAVSQVWEDAELISQPLVVYFRKCDEESCYDPNWLASLRSLNKSWCARVTSYIVKINCDNGDLEQLAKSLAGTFKHVETVAISNFDRLCLSIDETEGSIYCSGDEDHLLGAVLNSSGNVRKMRIDFERHEEMCRIAPLKSLKELYVRDCDDLGFVSACPNLVFLESVCCRLCTATLAGLKHLKRLHVQIASLGQIEGFAVDGEGEEEITQFPSITELHFRCASSPSNLLGNRNVLGLLKRLPNLRVLHFKANGIVRTDGNESQVFLEALPPSLEELDLQDMFSSNDQTLAHLEHLTKLKSLSVGKGGNPLEHGCFEWVTKLSNISTLNLSASHVLDPSFAWLRSLPMLRTLNLRVYELGPTAFTQLSWVKSLREIEITGLNNTDQLVSDENVREAYNRILNRGTLFKPLLFSSE